MSLTPEYADEASLREAMEYAFQPVWKAPNIPDARDVVSIEITTPGWIALTIMDEIETVNVDSFRLANA